MKYISIIIPILNEEKYIKQCLDSVLSSDYPQEVIEILLVDGISSDKTRDIIAEYQKNYSFIKLLDNPNKIVPKAMNLAIEEAKGEYIFRLDAHASYPENYFSQLIAWHQKLNAANIGTSIETKVKNSNIKSLAIQNVLSSPFGVGNSDFRLGVDKLKEVDTVPFGCFPKEVFSKYGLYDERLVRNQDIELNKRIIKRGGKIYLIPNVKCTYYARETFTALSKNNYNNGFWNILTSYYTQTLSSLSLRHFIPLLFVLSLFVPIFGAIIFSKILWIAFFSLVSYLSLVIIISIKMNTKIISILYTVGSFLILHFSYGVGSLMGIGSICKKYIKGKN